MTRLTNSALPNEQASKLLAEKLAEININESNLPFLNERGTFYSVAPESATVSRLLQFEAGALFAAAEVANDISSSLMIAELICGRFGGSDNFRCLIEEPYLRPGEAPEISGDLTQIEDRFYRVFPCRPCSLSSLGDIIERFTVSWSFLLIVSDLSSSIKLSEIVARAQLIVCGAYDGESYIYWLRANNGN